ncbi:hypothetical protein CEXT_341741 [Caerostris extrusa]|uniref:Uncharacterized protein n=1 Tax=Caerostris extrusa TaxID=172846 RepID=A0AAV4QW18_CAEEX|nr:hypothetical protein CEXT_341741 [Caerostris extrusa]
MPLLHAPERSQTFPFQFLRSSTPKRSKERMKPSKPFPRTMILNSVPGSEAGPPSENASLFLSRPMRGQPCGIELPLGWLHLQPKNLGSPIRFFLDGFTVCGQSILPQKRGGRTLPILLLTTSFIYRCLCYTLQRDSERSIPVSSLQHTQKKQRASEAIKTISTNNASKFCSGPWKQGLQRSIRSASLFLSRPMPGQPCGRDLPFGWLHLQLKNLGSPIRFLLDGFTMCGQSILSEKGGGRTLVT